MGLLVRFVLFKWMLLRKTGKGFEMRSFCRRQEMVAGGWIIRV